jgi:hypothetical protein
MNDAPTAGKQSIAAEHQANSKAMHFALPRWRPTRVNPLAQVLRAGLCRSLLARSRAGPAFALIRVTFGPDEPNPSFSGPKRPAGWRAGRAANPLSEEAKCPIT